MFSTISPRCDFMPTISEAAEDVHHNTNNYTHHHHLLSKKKENLQRLYYNEIDDRDKAQNHVSVYQDYVGNSESNEEADIKTFEEEENNMSNDFDGIGSILDCVDRNDNEENNVVKLDTENNRTDYVEAAEDKHNIVDSRFTVTAFTSSVSTISSRLDNPNSVHGKTINHHVNQSSASTKVNNNPSIGKTVNVQYRKKWNAFTIKHD